MKEISNITQNVDLITFGEKKIYLIGTAHISNKSAELVKETINQYQPEVVCVELCPSRYQSLQEPNRWRETDIFSLIKEEQQYVLLAQLMLASFQKKLAKKFGVEPGVEMKEAISSANEIGAMVSTIDREIKTTLKRSWRNTGFFSSLRLFFALIVSCFTQEDINEEELERLKEGDMLSALLTEFATYLPQVKTSLIDERDQYMAAKIYATKGKTICAIVGAGHVPGIKRSLGEEIDLAELESIPPSNPLWKIIGWVFPVIIIIAIIYGFIIAGTETGMEMAYNWVYITAIFSGLGALIALAHPLTILSAAIAAPFTTLNPTIAAGWVSGLVEAYLRKPRVMDLETITDDISSIKGLWKNRVSKVFLVVIFTNIGAMIGMIIATYKIANLLP